MINSIISILNFAIKDLKYESEKENPEEEVRVTLTIALK